MMQKEGNAIRPRFILPKPVSKHEHNIRFLTPKSHRSRQAFSGGEGNSKGSLSLKLDNFKRDLLTFQMKNKVKETMNGNDDKQSMLKADEQVNQLNKPPLYATATQKSGDFLESGSRQPPSFVFAKPCTQPRLNPNKAASYRTSTFGKPQSRSVETRQELNMFQPALPQKDSQISQEEAAVPKFLLSSEIRNTTTSDKVSFFREAMPQSSAVSWKLSGKGMGQTVEISRGAKDLASSTVSDTVRFDQVTKSSSSISMNPRTSLLQMPSRAQKLTQSQFQMQPNQQVPVASLIKNVNRYKLGIDARKRQLEHVKMRLANPENQTSGGPSNLSSSRRLFKLENSSSYHYVDVPDSPEPIRKAARHVSPESDSQARLIGNRGKAANFVPPNYHDVVGSPSPPSEKSQMAVRNEFYEDVPTFVPNRTTTIIRGGQKTQRDVNSEFYQDGLIVSNNPPADNCDCHECQTAYSASKGGGLFSGGMERSANNYSPFRRNGDRPGYKNGDISRYEIEIPTLKRGLSEEVNTVSERSAFDPYLLSGSLKGRDEAFGDSNRSKIFYFHKNENSTQSRIFYDRARTEGEVSNSNELADARFGRRDDIPAYSEPKYAQTRYTDANSTERNYVDFINRSYPEVTRTNADPTQRSSLNSTPERGSPSSEKFRNPPRLIGSNSRAMDAYRERSNEKSYSEISQGYETNSPRLRTPEAVHMREVPRPGTKRKTNVVVTYSYPRRQRMMEKGENVASIESVAYRIHERVIYFEDEASNSVKIDVIRPRSKERLIDNGRIAADFEIKVRCLKLSWLLYIISVFSFVM